MRWSVALVVVAACQSDDPVAGPRTWDGDFLADSILITCQPYPWVYDVWTQGWGKDVTVDFVGRNPDHTVAIHEHHSIPEVDFDETTSHHQLTLEQTYGDEDYTPGATTALPCEDKTFVTYGFTMWRYDGDIQECVAWGIDPVGDFPDCANWGADGHTYY